MARSTTAPRKADYYLFHWQIQAIRQLAKDSHQPPSAIVRELLTRALAADEASGADSHGATTHADQTSPPYA